MYAAYIFHSYDQWYEEFIHIDNFWGAWKNLPGQVPPKSFFQAQKVLFSPDNLYTSAIHGVWEWLSSG